MRDQIAQLVRTAVAQAQSAGQLPNVTLPDVGIERPPKADMGDFATSFPLRAKRAVGPQGPKPVEIGAIISAQIAQDVPSYLATVQVAAQGFLNFTLAEEWLQAQVDTVLAAGSDYGQVDLGQGRTVQVEYVSANPTGPLHVGSGRNAALGDSLARVLEKANWQVQREYYFNDAGNQVNNLHHSVWVRYQQLLGRDVEPSDTDYLGEYVIDLAREIHAEHGDAFKDAPEDQPGELGELAVARIIQWIKDDLAKMGCTFDRWFSEASLVREGDFKAILDQLRGQDLIFDREGATWLRSTQFGDSRDRVVVKSEGLPTYTGTDIAYHYDKLIKRGFDRVIDVWGADHQGQVPTMKAIAQAIGVDPERLDILLYQLVNVLRNGQVVRMGKRAGNFVTLGEVLDEVGPDATRWFLVSRSATATMDFDLDLAKKQSSENPVYYVQYAHARLAKILREAAANAADGDVRLLTHPTELALIRRMLQFPEVVEMAAQGMAPHHVPTYAYELARATQAWYEAGNDDPAQRVLAADPALQAARLKLAAAARQVLANALDLIGVGAPESM